MIEAIRTHVVPYAYSILPEAMEDERATNLLMAIGWHESKFAKRVQDRGPAKGFWQFEQSGGVRGVLGHKQTAPVALKVLKTLGYPFDHTPFGVYCAIEHNDVLAFCFARLLLWTVPAPLPHKDQVQEGWRQYAAAWRPGKPRIEEWPHAWGVAWGK